MKSLYYSNDVAVDHAYIITIKGNEKSEKFSKRCQQSCDDVGMKYKVWDAFDGTRGDIVVPEQCTDDSIIKILKVTDHYMTRGEVACALSHISLWSHCAQIDKPIIILEHDAIMMKKFDVRGSYNSIVYLGGAEWVEHKWPMLMIPPHASEGPNKHFICRAHAYCIDPVVAKNMLAHVIKNGICDPLDIMIRADLFNITHQGLFACDRHMGDTTIPSRPQDGRTTKRNDKLAW